MTRALTSFQIAALCFGFAFLYVPIALLVIFSFNASRLVTVWAGFSTRWYAALLDNEAFLAAASTSLRVAFVAAALASLIGLAAAIALARFGAFRGRMVFAALIYAPLVVPEVMIGLSLLLVFVAFGVPRGFWTVVIAHATMGACFVAIVVHARLASLERSLEEAAMDLGASPLTMFCTITLPLALPALAAGFMLAFTLSLDDFVLASFTSGPGSTTLPMRIYSQARLGVTPEVNAASTLMIACVGIALLIAWFCGWLRARSSRRF